MNKTRVYLDSCIAIYFVEGSFGLRSQIVERYPDPASVVFCTSPIVRLECLVGAYQRSNKELAANYLRFLKNTVQVDVSEQAWERAATIRAETRLGVPDALHLAVAELSGCGVFWTSDHHFESARHAVAIDMDLTEFSHD